MVVIDNLNNDSVLFKVSVQATMEMKHQQSFRKLSEKIYKIWLI